MHISHILFDFGGVVIDHKVPDALPRIFEQLSDHYNVTPQEAKAFWNKEIDPEYLAGTMTYDEVIALHVDHFWKPLPENHKDICIAPMGHALFHKNIETYIYALKEQWYVVGLLSDMTKERRDVYMNKWWYDSFDILFNSCDLGYSKAKDHRDNTTDIYGYVLDNLWVIWEKCLFIDDKIVNCTQANKVGIQTIQAVNPEQIIQDVSDFLEKNK